jgi:ornithine carbamoyltransferase
VPISLLHHWDNLQNLPFAKTSLHKITKIILTLGIIQYLKEAIRKVRIIKEEPMRDKFRGKDFLSLMDFTQEEIMDMIDVSYDLKKKWATKEPHEYLRGRTFAALFEKPSTRTRNSFQVGAAHLGAQAIYIRPDELQLSRGESIRDTAMVLNRYYDALFIRPASGTGQERVNEFAKHMEIPVINAAAISRIRARPCDLMTIWEKKAFED